MNYAELVTAVSDYCENNFPTTDMNIMIRQAEQKLYNSVQLPSLRRNVTGTLTQGNKYLACPNDFLSVYSLAIYPAGGGEYLYLLNKDVNFIREAYSNPTTQGKPKHYAIFGPRSDNEDELVFILGPTPDSNYGAELHYYYYPESIVTSGQTWLGDNFDSALLNGTIYEAAMYMRMEQDTVALVKERYLQSVALLKNLGDGKLRMDAYRDGQVRVSVS